jgi:hypothetical protein
MHLVALLIALPALLGAGALVAIETWRGTRQELPPQPAVTVTFADALRSRDVVYAFAWIVAGQDPNQLITFKDPILTDDRLLDLAPMQIAAAKRDSDMVMMLLSFGALAELPANRLAACVAEANGDQRLARLIRDAAGPWEGPCPVTDSETPILEAFSPPRYRGL